MRLGDGCWLGRHVHSVRLMTTLAVLLQSLLKLRQPLGNQVDILCKVLLSIIDQCDECGEQVYL